MLCVMLKCRLVSTVNIPKYQRAKNKFSGWPVQSDHMWVKLTLCGLHINNCYISSKCTEGYEGSCTSVKQSLLIAIKFYAITQHLLIRI